MPLPRSKVRELLVVAGKWREFQHRRDTLKAEGYSAAQAYQAALAEFDEYLTEDIAGAGADRLSDPSPPIAGTGQRPRSAGPVSAPAPDEQVNLPGIRARVNFRDDVFWAYQCLEEANPDFDTAPSNGAIALWRWARAAANTSDFFKYILSKTLPTRSEQEAEDRFKDDGRSLDRLLGEVAEASARAAGAAR